MKVVTAHVVLNDKDYYGPHFDDFFISREELDAHILKNYTHKHQYEVLSYNLVGVFTL